MKEETRDAKNERYEWVQKMVVGLADSWIHDISKDRLHDKVIAEIMQTLDPFIGLGTFGMSNETNKDVPVMYALWFRYFRAYRDKKGITLYPDQLIVSLFMGTNTKTMFFPEINQELIDLVYKKTWDIEWWNAECQKYKCDPSKPAHKYLAFAIALQMWYDKLYKKAVDEAFF